MSSDNPNMGSTGQASAGSGGSAFESEGGSGAATMTDQARNVADQAREKMRTAGAEASRVAADVAEKARSRGESYVAGQKEWAADEVQHIGSAVRRAAETLREEGDERVASYIERTADGIDDVSNYLRERDLGGLFGDVERLARRRPEIFFGGMFLVGLGISRFLKASGETRRRQSYEGSEFGGYGESQGSGQMGSGQTGSGQTGFQGREFENTTSYGGDYGQSYT